MYIFDVVPLWYIVKLDYDRNYYSNIGISTEIANKTTTTSNNATSSHIKCINTEYA